MGGFDDSLGGEKGRGIVLGGVGEGENERREDIAQERILVPDERKRLRELGLCVGVVLECLGGGGTHSESGGFVCCRRRGLLLDGAEEGTH